MERNSKKLKLRSKVRFEVIKQGITRFQKTMLSMMIGKNKIIEELIEEFKQQEDLELKFTNETKPQVIQTSGKAFNVSFVENQDISQSFVEKENPQKP